MPSSTSHTHICRFEMPDPAWCMGCGRHINRGTRFNARKDGAGAYYSTKIWAFFMKCPSCPQQFIIKTDPKVRFYLSIWCMLWWSPSIVIFNPNYSGHLFRTGIMSLWRGLKSRERDTTLKKLVLR